MTFGFASGRELILFENIYPFAKKLRQMKNQISEFLQSRIDAKDFPSAVYLVAEKGEIILQDALGLAVVEPEKIEAKIDTIYDLASLTKPLVIGLLFAKLVESGEINLIDKIDEF